MFIISSKKLHFQKFKYTKDVKTQETIANVEDEIMVSPDARPQIVPDWVRDNDLFKLCIEDESVIEITVVSQIAKTTSGVNNTPKVNIQGVKQAKFADPKTGAESKLVPVGTGAAVGGDWPKANVGPR